MYLCSISQIKSCLKILYKNIGINIVMPFGHFVNGDRHTYFGLTSVIILFIASGLMIIGCQPSGDEASKIALDWKIEPNPPQVGMATIKFTLRDSTEQLIEGADIRLEGTMSHPGMTPVIVTAEETAPGKYSAEMEFTMGGDWIILIKLALDEERVVERQIEIPRVRSDP